jgi:cardiolipin synthase A/B
MGKRAPKTNRWHGLDRQRQSNRPKLPKGLPGWSARLRSLLWSWWVWAIAAVAAQTSDRPYTALSLVFVATFVYLAAPSERAPVYGLDHEFGIESDEFLSTIMGATDTPFAPGNRLDIYNNGDQFYPVMMDAISQAKESITIEAYIYWAGHVGRLFADALATKAREGVPVKILLDSLGSSTIGSEILEALESSGCIVKWYRPLHW